MGSEVGGGSVHTLGCTLRTYSDGQGATCMAMMKTDVRLGGGNT